MPWHVLGSGCIIGSAFSTANSPMSRSSGPLPQLIDLRVHQEHGSAQLSNVRKSPYGRISPRLQLRRCFLWLLEYHLTNCSQGGTQAPLPPKKTQPLIFKKRFLAFTCHPLSLLCEPPLCISLGWFSIQNRSKSLNFSGQFLTLLFLLPSPFQAPLQDSVQYHIQANTQFHSIPLVILPITILSGSKFPQATFHIKC